MDPTYPLFPIFAFLSFCFVLIPLPWHIEALNSGTCLYIIWTAVGCLNQFINSIIWEGNIVDWAPLWCDISTRLMVGISVAIPSASLCINRRLYKIATCHSSSISYAEKRRAVFVDLGIGLGFPALQMILQFIVQGHRYDIFEDIGCLPTTVNTPSAYPLSFLWPNLISLASATYCCLTIRAFMIRRAQFSQFLSSSTSLSIHRYFRLMCLATTEILFTIPISSYGLYLNIISKPIYPWISWSDIHFDWYTIDTIPAALWRSNRLFTASLELERWSVIICAVVFFGFFGFAEEARRNYRRLFRAISQRCPHFHSSKKAYIPKGIFLQTKNTSGTLPVFIHTGANQPSAKSDAQSISSRISNETTAYTDTLYGSPTPKTKVYAFETADSASSRASRFTI